MIRRSATLLVLSAALLTGCAADGDDDPTILVPSESAAAGATTAPPEPTGSASGVPADDVDQVVSLTVASGEVSGDSGRVAVRLGTRIRITVTADVTDEVHVHGYDLTFQTSPGAPASIELLADRPGVFEVELHGGHTVLTRLQVS